MYTFHGYDRFREKIDLDYLIGKINEFTIEKSKSDFEAYQFVMQELESMYPRVAVSELSILESYPPGLNQKEIALYLKDPIKGTKAIYHGNTAASQAEARYTDSATDGNGDAFRHMAWTALMTANIDWRWAIDWSTAHEEGDTLQGALGKEMDTINNNIGVSLATANKGVPEDELFSIIERQIRNGFGRRIVNGVLVPTNGDNHK